MGAGGFGPLGSSVKARGREERSVVDLNAMMCGFVDRLVMCDCFVVGCTNDDVVVKLSNAD